MELAVLCVVIAALIGEGVYLALKERPVEPKFDLLLDLAQRCLPKETEGMTHWEELGQPDPLEPHEEALRARNLV